MILSLCGGALGLIFAHFGIHLLLKFFADKFPRMGDIGLSVPILLFTFGLSVVTGHALRPSSRFSMVKADVNESLKQGLGRIDTDSGSGLTRSVLVSVEVALSIVLLIGAGLMLRSLWSLQAVDPGFDPAQRLTLALEVPRHQFNAPTQETQFFDQVFNVCVRFPV